MSILFTGFGAFGKIKTNPSRKVIEYLSKTKKSITRTQCIYEVLDVIYATAGQRIEQLIDEHRPNLIILTGVAAERKHVSLEQFAQNLDDSVAPDNAGEIRIAKPIALSRKKTLRTALPLKECRDAISTSELPIELSVDAGNYVCNHVYFRALIHLSKKQQPANCVFIHLPNFGGTFRTAEKLAECVSDCAAFFRQHV